MKKVSQSMIAEKLHLSRTTVYKVLQNLPGTTEGTRRQVLEMAAELGYLSPVVDEWRASQVPAEKTSTTYDIALVSSYDTSDNVFWTPIIRAAEKVLSGSAAFLRLTIVSYEEEKQLILPALLKLKKPDGMILLGAFSKAYYERLHELSIPFVSYDIAPKLFGIEKICDIVMVDNQSATYAITKHLLNKGARHIAFAGATDSCQSFLERFEGYRDAMTDSGFSDNICTLGAYSPMHLYNEGAKVFYSYTKRMLPLDAVVCANDFIANTFIKRLRPPMNLLLSGFDAIESFEPALSQTSTVQLFPAEIGEALAHQILWRLSNPSFAYRTIRLGAKLILR